MAEMYGFGNGPGKQNPPETPHRSTSSLIGVNLPGFRRRTTPGLVAGFQTRTYTRKSRLRRLSIASAEILTDYADVWLASNG